MGHATYIPRLVATSHRLASCVIVSRFRTALDLDTYPLSNFIRPRCAERAKRGRGKHTYQPTDINLLDIIIDFA